MSTLSVNILTHNSAATLDTCLESVAWADEIIIFDNGSTDDTLSIAKRYNAHVHSTDWPGFTQQRERALAASTKEWVLVIDSDEAVTDKLAKTIQKTIAEPSRYSGYKLIRRDIIAGKCARFAGSRGYLRLVKREKMAIRKRHIHECIEAKEGPTKLLTPGILLHQPFSSLDHIISKNNEYTRLSVLELAQNKKSSLWKAVGHGLWCFFKHYILKGGFLDGATGFIIVSARVQQSFWRHAKLWYHQKEDHLTLKEAFQKEP